MAIAIFLIIMRKICLAILLCSVLSNAYLPDGYKELGRADIICKFGRSFTYSDTGMVCNHIFPDNQNSSFRILFNGGQNFRSEIQPNSYNVGIYCNGNFENYQTLVSFTSSNSPVLYQRPEAVFIVGELQIKDRTTNDAIVARGPLEGAFFDDSEYSISPCGAEVCLSGGIYATTTVSYRLPDRNFLLYDTCSGTAIYAAVAMEHEDCYDSYEAASADLRRRENECLAKEMRPGIVQTGNCLIGGCVEKYESNPSNGDASGLSSSSGSENNACLVSASKPFLQKPVNYYDDWVYMGKESYGSRHVTRSSLKSGTKFFDVLGRTYDKMKARIKYYVFKDAVEKEEFDVPFEFEVYARIIKDSEGNDIQVFIKEDKARGLRRDSSFYWDGSWEVMETDEVDRTIKSKTSLGIKVVNLFDNKWRVTNKVMIDKNNDTIALEQYVWKNGRLAKTIFNGLERVFVYGKTLQDTIRVIPSDNEIGFHSGYDNTAGRIPSEDDEEYSSFVLSPYSVYGVKQKKPILLKYQVSTKIEDMPDPQYHDPNLQQCTDIKVICGKERGWSVTYPYLESECKDDGCGKYIVNYTARPDYDSEEIHLYQAYFKYELSNVTNPHIPVYKWRRYCTAQPELDLTYKHEAQHILNGRNRTTLFAEKNMPKDTFPTKNECNVARATARRKFDMEWMNWSFIESQHSNWDSPVQRYFQESGELCEPQP